MMTTISSQVLAQKKYKVIQWGDTSGVINVSADELWKIIGPGFENAGEWATAVDHSTGDTTPKFEGATCNERYCKINAKGFNQLTEVITIYDQEGRTLAFDVTEGLPGFVIVSNSHWQIIEVGENQSRVEITITAQTKKLMGSMMGGMLKSNIKKVIPGLFRDLKVYAETGEISPEKQERKKKLEAKQLAEN